MRRYVGVVGSGNYSAVTRRNFIRLGLAGSSATVAPNVVGAGLAPHLPGSAAVAALPWVKPISAQAASLAFGVCALPQQIGHSPYQYTNEWMAVLDRLGAAWFRGLYDHDTRSARDTTRAAREHGIKWGMTVCPDLSYPDSALITRIRHIASNAADRSLFIAGINEPNADNGTVPRNWASRTVAKQKVIWQTVKSDQRLAHVRVVGPKLNSNFGTERQFRELGAAGIARYMDEAALAGYPGGMYPYDDLSQLLTWVNRYWGGKPAYIAETGYNNALAASSGPSTVPVDVAATYAPALLLEAVQRNCRVSVFELLDSPDPGADDNKAAHWGMYESPDDRMAPPWRAKPIAESLQAFLSRLKDPGPRYDPQRIRLSVTSAARDVRSTVTAKRNGAATVHLRRSKNSWDTERRVRIPVPEVDVTIRTAQGSRTVRVGSRVRSFAL